MAQTDPFPLATTGCSKAHCTMHEDGAIGIAPPTGMSGTGSALGRVHYFYTGGNDKGEGCSSSGSMVACTSKDGSPSLTVYNASGTSVLFTSCSTPSVTNCSSGTPANDPCGTPVTDFLNSDLGTALVGSDGTLIIADSLRMYRFKSDGTKVWGTCLSSAANGFQPHGIIVTADSSGDENITLLTNNGPVSTYKAESGVVVYTPDSGMTNRTYFQPDPSSDTRGSYYYTGTNSACAVGNRIYAVMNRYYHGAIPGGGTYTPTNQPAGTYQDGVLYAFEIGHSNPGVTIVARFWFNNNNDSNGNPMNGPSSASPMCSPSSDYGIFTDFGSTVPGQGPQANKAGVLAVTDCTSSVWGGTPPSYCDLNPSTNPNEPFQLRYALNTDQPSSSSLPSISGCDPSGTCQDYITANMPWDPGNSCLWVFLKDSPVIPKMTCLSSGVSGSSIVAPTAVNTIDVSSSGIGGALPFTPAAAHEHAASDITVTSDGSGHTILIVGTQDTVGGHQAVLAINTASSGGSLFWYYLPGSFAAGQFAISTDSYSNPLVWFTDNSNGTYAVGDCGGSGQQGCS